MELTEDNEMIAAIIHRMSHFLGWNEGKGWNDGKREEWMRGSRMMIGFRCKCGRLSGVHESQTYRWSRVSAGAVLLLALLSTPATAQDVSFTDRLIWNNPESPRGEIPYAQTGQQPARRWGTIFPPGDDGAGDVLCFEATGKGDPVNDGCYTVARAVFGDSYWVIIFEEDPPAWFFELFVEYLVTWYPVELFDDDFEGGTTSDWSLTVGGRRF